MTGCLRHNPDCGKLHITNTQIFQQISYRNAGGGGTGEGEETRDTSTNCKGWSYLNLDSNTVKKLSKTIEEIQTLTGYLIVIKVLLLILKCENDIAVMFNERVLSF